MSRPIAIVSLGARSRALAERLAAALPGAAVHAPAPASSAADRPFTDLAQHLRSLFAEDTAIVGLCASGILIRILAPLLEDKRSEPPVLAVAADGSAVVPLLGGHHGANRLAREVAAALGTTAAITTAGETLLGAALDEPPPGWVLRHPAAAKRVMARLLDGEPAQVSGEDGLDADWLGVPHTPGAQLKLGASVREGAAGDLVVTPRAVALGVGCERDTPPAALIAHAEACLAEAHVAREAVGCVVSIDLKAAEPAVHALASAFGAEARFFPAERLEHEAARLTIRSDAVRRETGVWGVAEAAALAAVGDHGRLLLPKRVGQRVTCALALAPRPIEPAAVGRTRGRLSVVGLGPGGPAWRTAEAGRLLAAADELVGYGLYLDLAGPVAVGKRHHAFPLGAETERCRFAWDRAAEGRHVALVASGDPGVYALATLLLELLEHEGTPAWHRVALEITPGVSALLAAAARAGAPLGHDFCAVSLSDLMTPWDGIEQRLRAAAEGDFVVALYNPVSARRREGLRRARDILLEHRAPATPAIIARNVARADERVDLITLAELAPERVDMLSLVIVGSSTTRRFAKLHGGDWVYTPRGYEVG